MPRKRLIAVALSTALIFGTGSGTFAFYTGLGPGPGPWVTGNDTGGIIPYSPDLKGAYRGMAAAHCARWNRLAHVTSVGRRYGDYISFVCIDKRSMIH